MYGKIRKTPRLVKFADALNLKLIIPRQKLKFNVINLIFIMLIFIIIVLNILNYTEPIFFNL